MMGGRQGTGRIGCRGIAGEQQGLAAASAEIFGAAVATAAWFGHPFFSAKTLE